jgi:ferredoxin
MSTTIYYFSGTGNSYHIAKELQKQIEDCKLAAISGEYKKSKIVPDSKKVGFVFPLYFQSMPKAVMEFVEKLDVGNCEYLFAVVTRGGYALQGGVFNHLKKILEGKGAKLSACFYIKMPENYIPVFKVPPKKEQEKMFNAASQKLKVISDCINSNGKRHEKEFLSFLRASMHNRFIGRLEKIHEGFNVKDSCNSCGLCEKICKFNNISLTGRKPLWQNNCQFCMACINYCPGNSIEYKNSTKGKGRYNHPDVPASIYTGI